jgi:dTDP-4-dehydrorhamnose reductase
MCLCERLLAACCTVVFISTAAVFDGQQPYPSEASVAGPGTRYGMQKYRVERALTESLQQGGRVKIIRLSKVISSAMPLLVGWRHALLRGEIIKPLSDLRLSPVSLRYVVAGLIKIALLEQCGLFHLSGKSDVSYANFATLLATKWGLSSSLICPSTSRDLSAHLPYAPRYPSLGMSQTEAMAQISPQKLADCIADLTAQGSL